MNHNSQLITLYANVSPCVHRTISYAVFYVKQNNLKIFVNRTNFTFCDAYSRHKDN